MLKKKEAGSAAPASSILVFSRAVRPQQRKRPAGKV